MGVYLNFLVTQDASNFLDDSFSRHFGSSTSQIRVTVTDDDEDTNNLDSTTVSLDPAGNSRRNPDLNDSRLSSYGCDMDMETYQAQLAEATNALLVADKCKCPIQVECQLAS